MLEPSVLIETERRPDTVAIARYIRDQLDDGRGDPVVAISGLRLVIRSETMIAIGASTVEDLAQLLHPLQVRLTAISDARLVELLNGRNGPELPIPRPPASEPAAGSKYDWHLHACAIPQAWSLVAGGQFDQIDWTGIRIGHIDTGYRPHPALGWAEHTSTFVDTDRDRNFCARDIGLPGYSEENALDPLRGGAFDGHGTRTSSVLAGFYRHGASLGALTGYFGAAPQVPIVPVRISDSVLISDAQEALALAIDHVVASGCKVISLSMGFPLILGGGVTRGLKTALNQAYEAGVIFVSASGNYLQSVVAPAALGRTIAVGGTTPSDDTWRHGSHGPEVDICAPAADVYRASVDRDGSPIYGHGDGTSFATALVAGTCALWLARHGGAIPARYSQPWQIVAAFRHVLSATARKPSGWDSDNFGAGILNAYALLQAKLPEPGMLNQERPI